MYLLIPDLLLFFYHHNLQLLLMSFFSLIYIYSIIKTTKYLFLFIPFLILIPAYIYYISIYKVNISEQILNILFETNIQEATQFLGGNLFIYLFIYLIWIIYVVYISFCNYKKPKVWTHWTRILILIFGTCYFFLGYYLNAKVVTEIHNSLRSSDSHFLVVEENDFLKEIKKTYPLGLLVNISTMLEEQKKINMAFKKNEAFQFDAKKNQFVNEKEIYVLVLGETSRRESWQLNNYERKTNPKLNKQENLVNFTDLVSVSSETRSSIPIILTRKTDKDVYKYDFSEKSVISAYKEAGFKTYWISTQQKFGAYDTSTSVYAREADEVHFLNKTGYANLGEYDDILIPFFKKIIQNKEKKQLIIIHTLGSHYNYDHRYPKAFEEFKPVLSSLKKYSLQEIKYKQELKNSYDNSILFTDYVLNNFIEILKQRKNVLSFLIYSSDHGEDLFDKKCLQSGHGLTTARNFEIAGFMWYSDKFQEKFPLKVINLKNNKNREISQTAIFPSLIDAADISIPNEQLSRSVLKDFKKYPRLVMGGVDYDHADFIGNCREIK